MALGIYAKNTDSVISNWGAGWAFADNDPTKDADAYGQALYFTSWNSYFNGSGRADGNWHTMDLTFNVPDGYEYVWFVFGMNAEQAYFDNFNLEMADRVDVKFTPTASVGTGGVYPTYQTMAYNETQKEMTFTAVPVGNAAFEGWYLNGAKVSSDDIITRTFKKTDKLDAHFSNATNNLATDSGAEEYAVGEDFYYGTSTTKHDGDFYYVNVGSATGIDNQLKFAVTDEAAHSGKKSFKVSNPGWRRVYRNFSGLKKNTTYVLSFYMMTYDNDPGFYLQCTGVGKKSELFDKAYTAIYNKTPDYESLYSGRLADYSAGNGFWFCGYSSNGSNYRFEEPQAGKWQYVTYSFNTGDETGVSLMFGAGLAAAGSTLYLDDFMIQKVDSAANVHNITASSNDGGKAAYSAVINENGGNNYRNYVADNTKVAFMAVPDYNDATGKYFTFSKWVNADNESEVVSTNPVFILNATKDIQVKAVFDSITIGIGTVGLGGTANCSLPLGAYPKGTTAVFDATPLAGNTFDGWYDADTNVRVSKDAHYVSVGDADSVLNPKFSGNNMPAVERFGFGGFENMTTSQLNNNPDFWFSINDPTFPNSVPQGFGASVSDWRAYEGKQSMRLLTRWRNWYMHLTSLNTNANYKLTFYTQMQYNDEKAGIDRYWVGPYNIDPKSVQSECLVYYKGPGELKGGPGWTKVELYFKTGLDVSDINFGLRYEVSEPSGSRETYAHGYDMDMCYLDNFELWEYAAQDELSNGAFNNSNDWATFNGSTSVSSNTATISGNGGTLSQIVNVQPFTPYKLSFDATVNGGSSLVAGAVDIGDQIVNSKNAISNIAYKTITANGRQEIYFTTSNEKALQVAFTNSGSGSVSLKDVRFEKDLDNTSEGVIDSVDFETDRFAVSDFSIYKDIFNNPVEQPVQSQAFEIYDKRTQGNSPANVRTGNRSLLIKQQDGAAKAVKLWQAWSTFAVQSGGAYQLTLWYKFAAPKGAFYCTPDTTGVYCSDDVFYAEDTNWHQLKFNLSNSQGYEYLRMSLGTIAGSADSDIYIDDVVFRIAPPTVTEQNPRTLYTENLYNAFDNEGFEKPFTSDDWAGVPSSFVRVKGTDKVPAFTQDYYLKAGKTNKAYVKSVSVTPGDVYFFAASVRSALDTNGKNVSGDSFVGIATNQAGTEFLLNDEEQPASLFKVTQTDGSWKRYGFRFVAPTSGEVTLVIDSTYGDIMIDNIMLFTDKHKYAYDPNDYTDYSIPYDFDDMSNAIINGGDPDTAQPYYKGNLNEGVDDYDTRWPTYNARGTLLTQNITAFEETTNSIWVYAMLIMSILTVGGAIALTIVKSRRKEDK
ncbi:MAG: hypothetical protein KBS41_05140 [Oscillospiraceae bacterium]|nr:hypothetical protein [Candidatus Equicaccousia limihippi]